MASSRITVSEIRNHVSELISLNERFSTLSNQSVEKFGKIIETAQVYYDQMEPLNKYMETLQVQKRNIQACYDKLNQIQNFRKTARELEAAVERGPIETLQSYLDVLKRVIDAFDFFKHNSIDEVEATRLQALYTTGIRKLTDEFQRILKSAFVQMDVNQLYNLVEKSTSTDSDKHHTDPMDEVALIEIPSEPMIESMKSLISWLYSVQGTLIATTNNGGEGLKTCVNRYHEHRREVVRNTLNKLRQFLKNRDSQAQQPTSGPGSRITRARTTRPPGFVWDVAYRRQVNELETEELNSEHLGISFVALVKLMQNERRWLLRIQMTRSALETQSSLESILTVSSNELLNECQFMLRMMQLAAKRAEYHMVLSLVIVLKKISTIGFELVDILQGMDKLLFGFNSLTFRLLQETAAALQNYITFLGRLPEHATVNRAIVPRDATVHELTTNSFMFFENLLEFADVLSVAFRLNEVGGQGSANVVHFLCRSVQKYNQIGPHVGQFLLNAIAALVDNLECKSGSYQEELLQLIFQMNNLQYIVKAINRTEIHRHISCYKSDGVSCINSILDERKGRYTRLVAGMLQLPPSAVLSRLANSTERHVDSKDRAAVKSLWQNFNSGFQSFLRLHRGSSIPDRELRDSLQRQLLSDLIPLYTPFWQQSMKVAFSTHRDKYMQFTVSDFESRIKQLFDTR